MSWCLICLVTAREVFLSQPNSSAITNVHKPNFSPLLYNQAYFVFKRINERQKWKGTLCKLDIYRQRPVCGFFPAECHSLRQTFQRIRRYIEV